jgi:hypothetical protein
MSYVIMLVICLRTKIHMPSSSCSFVVIVQEKELTLSQSLLVTFYFLNIICIFLQDGLP